MSREAFAMLLELQAAIESGGPPRAQVRAWFVASVDAWARSSSAKTLQEHLGLSRRLRRDWMLSRQRDHLDNALQAFAETRIGSAWDLAAEFVDELQRFERRGTDADPGTSRLNRALWLAFRVGLPVPTSREHWFLKLKAIDADGSVSVVSDVILEEKMLDYRIINEVRSKAEAQWLASPDLRRQFDKRDYSLSIAKEAEALHADRLAQFGRDPELRTRFENLHDYARAEVAAWITDRFSQGAVAPQPPEGSMANTASRPGSPVDAHDVEAAARREWERDPQLGDEFGNNAAGLESWIAYRKATAAGLVKTFGVRK